MWQKTLRRIGCDVVLSPSCRGQGRVLHDDSFDLPQLSFILSFYLALFPTPCTSITLTGDFNRILLIPQLTLVQFHLHLLSVSPATLTHFFSVYPKTPFLSLHSSLNIPVSRRDQSVGAPSYSALWSGRAEDIISTQPHPRCSTLH